MTEPRTLTDQILDQVVELTRDQQQLLAECATRMQPYANELITAWTNVYREMAAQQSLSAGASAIGMSEVAQSFFGELQRGNLRQALANLTLWIHHLAQAGLSYGGALKLVRELQRGALPLLTRAYASAPELPLALDAFDDLFDSMVALIGATYVQVLQERVAEGVQLRVLGQLTGGVAHSLNNLLAATLGRTRLLLERMRDEEARDELQEIQQSAALGAQMVRRLQDLSRTDPHAKFVDTDVNFLLRQIAEVTRFLWRDQAEANGIVIDVVKDFADVPPVRAKSSQLRWVLTELLLNAIEALPRGGLITLRTERRSDYVLISVVDNGEGMSEAAQARVFEPFFTTKGAPHIGLGLTTAQRIAAAHDGTLTVESAPGRGTIFTLALPVAPKPPVEKEEKTEPTARGANILVIDNEPSVRDAFSRLLSSRGHHVTSASDGNEGITAFKAGKFDIVFTDLGMPTMSGWDVARVIKKLNPKTTIVLMTGWPISLDAQKSKETGVDRVMNKPFDIPRLLALIEESLAPRGKKR